MSRRIVWASSATAEMVAKADGRIALTSGVVHIAEVEFDGEQARFRYDIQVLPENGVMSEPQWSEWTSWSDTWEPTGEP